MLSMHKPQSRRSCKARIHINYMAGIQATVIRICEPVLDFD